jgi:hypothetical protein
MNMPLHERGYLGEDIGKWIQKHRKENQEWFALAEGINLFANKTMYDLDIKTDDAQHLVVSTAYVRSLSLFQGTVIMAERGMIYEAALLTRGLMETLFVLCASAMSPDFALQYINSSELKKLDNVTKMLLAGPDIKKIIEETITKDQIEAKRLLLKTRGVRVFTIAEIAEKAGLIDYYRVNYSHFSLMAAHPTANSLDQYLEAGPSGDAVALLWGPDVKGVDRILSVAIESFIIEIGRVAEVFSQPWAEQVEKFQNKFRSLGELLLDFSMGHIRTQ